MAKLDTHALEIFISDPPPSLSCRRAERRIVGMPFFTSPTGSGPFPVSKGL